MNKFGLVAILFLILLIPQITSGDELVAKTDAEIIEKLSVSDTVAVIVFLDEDTAVSVGQEEVLILESAGLIPKADVIGIADVEVKETYSAAINGFAAEITQKGLEQLEDNDNVQRIYYDQIYELALQESIPQINASDVHIMSVDGVDVKGAGQTICVIDTGINYNHIDMGGCYGNNSLDSNCKVIGGWDTYDDDDDPMDENGHGTHVAGIAAANQLGITGVAPDAKLIAMKVFSASRTTTASKVIAGIDWCVSNASEYNISVITMSLSLTDDGNEVIFNDVSECDVYADGGVVNASNNAAAQGILISVAAGNDGNTTGIGSPACGSNVTSVGAVNDLDAVFYNRGSILDLLAPGITINSTAHDDNTGYVEMSGTSMSTPHVAGAAALLFQIANTKGVSVTPQDVEDALIEYAVTVSDVESGLNYSRINILNSVNYFMYPVLTYAENIENDSILANSLSTLNFTASDIGDIDTFWYNNGTDDIYDAYNISATEWFVDANWTAGDYNFTFYVNDSINTIANVSLTFKIDSAPAVDDWLLINETESLTNGFDVGLNEDQTINITLNVTDSDVYNNITYIWTLNAVEFNTTQNVTYYFDLQDGGEYNVTVNISDQYMDNLLSWNITVYDTAPPVWNDVIPNDTAVENDWTYNVSQYIDNLDNDTLTYIISNNTFNFENGVIYKNFDCDSAGDYLLELNLSDGNTVATTEFFLEVTETCSNDDNDDDDDDDDDDDGAGSSDGGDDDDDDDDSDLFNEGVSSTATTTTSPDVVVSNNTVAIDTTSNDELEEDVIGQSVSEFSVDNPRYNEAVSAIIITGVSVIYLRNHMRKGKGHKFNMKNITTRSKSKKPKE